MTGRASSATAANCGRPLGLRRMAELNQVHGDAMIFEPDAVEPDAVPRCDADGMATAQAGFGLVIKTADCQPILLAHKSGRFVAGIHAGWRGNRCDFPGSGVRRFCEHYGVEQRELLAVRGPSLGPARAEFINFESEWSDEFRPWFDAQSRTMDLWGLTRWQLEQAGCCRATSTASICARPAATASSSRTAA